MRLAICCVLMLVVPTLGMVLYKQYEIYEANQAELESFTKRLPKQSEVLFFNASWCGPCRQMKPIVNEMRHHGYRMRDIDIDQHRDLAQKYGIRGVPTFVVLQHGKEVKRFSGGTSPENLRKLCSSAHYN